MESPARYPSPRATGSSLVWGRKETKWSAGVGAPRAFTSFLAPLWSGSQLASPGTLALAWDVAGVCRSQQRAGGHVKEPGLLADHVRLGLVLYVWIGLRAVRPPACPLPRPRPRCRSCSQRPSCGCPRGFDSLAIKCVLSWA